MSGSRRELLSGVRLTNIPFSQLERLSKVLQKYRGTHYRLPASAGPMAMAVDVVCHFPGGRERLLFKTEWPPG